MRARGPHNATLAAVCGLALLASACGGLFDGGDTKAGLSCVDDSPECVEQRQVTLKAMLADKANRRPCRNRSRSGPTSGASRANGTIVTKR